MVERVITFMCRDGLLVVDGTATLAARCGSPHCPVAGAILRRRGLITPSMGALVGHGWPYRCDHDALTKG